MRTPLLVSHFANDADTGWRLAATVPEGETWELDFALLSNQSAGTIATYYLALLAPRPDSQNFSAGDVDTEGAIIWGGSTLATMSEAEKTWGSTSAPRPLPCPPGSALWLKVSTADDVVLLLAGTRVS